MCSGILEEALPNECLTQQKLNIFLRPIFRRQGLQKHHNFLEIHLHEFGRPLHEEGGADVQMELGEPLFFGLFRISS